MRKQGCKTVFPLLSPEKLSRTYMDVQVTLRITTLCWFGDQLWLCERISQPHLHLRWADSWRVRKGKGDKENGAVWTRRKWHGGRGERGHTIHSRFLREGILECTQLWPTVPTIITRCHHGLFTIKFLRCIMVKTTCASNISSVSVGPYHGNDNKNYHG